MGLTGASTALAALDGKERMKPRPGDRCLALVGNPNVGKSTVFNGLTGLRQHTGNWPGKTVGSARGRYEHRGRGYVLVDLPGTYSLMARSAEEEVTRDFLCFGGSDAAVVVCDATALERNLNLVLQVLELQPRTVVCVNLLDEAAKKGIEVDLPALAERLGVPVVGTAAGRGKGLPALKDAVEKLLDDPVPPTPRPVPYLTPIRQAADRLAAVLEPELGGVLSGRWVALRLLEGDRGTLEALSAGLGRRVGESETVRWRQWRRARRHQWGIGR